MKSIQIKWVVFIVVAGLLLGASYCYEKFMGTEEGLLPPEEMMNLTLYVQDKEIVRTSDCGVTKKVTYQIPKTSGVADVSLKILFQNELARYGTYQSVKIENGIAKVFIEPAFVSLSSCESGHLMSVVNDTLTQYDSIESVELYDKNGKIEF